MKLFGSLLMRSVVLLVLCVSCSYVVDKDEVVSWVKQSITEKVKKDPASAGFEVGEIALVRESASKFTGFVVFRFGKETEKADLVVTLDGNNRIYKCAPPLGLILKRNQIDDFLRAYPEYRDDLTQGRITAQLMSVAYRWGGQDFMKFISDFQGQVAVMQYLQNK